MEESSPSNNVGPSAVGAPAPAMDPQSDDLPCDDDNFDFDPNWDFETMTIRDVITTSLRVVMCFVFIIGCFAPFVAPFFDVD
jgi:hypothetical protein